MVRFRAAGRAVRSECGPPRLKQRQTKSGNENPEGFGSRQVSSGRRTAGRFLSAAASGGAGALCGGIRVRYDLGPNTIIHPIFANLNVSLAENLKFCVVEKGSWDGGPRIGAEEGGWGAM